MIDESAWVLLPIRTGSKRPIGNDWPEIYATPHHAPQPGENVGVHLGPSGLVDIDLDCPEAIELAPKFLPDTAVFGREQERSHWLYSGEATYRKFVDPVDKQCILEIRAGHGKQSVIPPSITPRSDSGELAPIVWHEECAPQPFFDPQIVANLAAMAWCKKHPGESIPDRVQGWLDGKFDAAPTAAASTDTAVFFDAVDQNLIDSIVSCCPDGSRHDYRLAVAGAMKRGGISETAAADMLAEAMASSVLGDDRSEAVRDARAAVADTYSTTRATTGRSTLISLGGQLVVDRVEALTTPTIKEISWLEQLEKLAVGGNTEPLEDAAIVQGLARLLLSKDSRLPTIWAKLKDGHYSHLKELKETVELRAREIRKKSIDPNAPPVPVDHAEAAGMAFPPGYHVDGGVLKCGDETIMHGELILLAKCPSAEGVHVRFAFRTPTNRTWRHSIAPYRALVDARGVLCLAEHGCNVSSLEAATIVGYVRDFVSCNEALLDRPVATSTGWHASGAYVWGREIINGPPELQAEYPADNQIASHYVAALHSKGDREQSFAALREAVETLPTAALCIASSLAACWVRLASRPTVGVHLAGMGGKGKTRTLKIAGSVWGDTGSSGSLAASGTVAGANTTQRALEIAASVRNDLPFLLSDVRPFPGLPEVLHAVLNGDPRARATQRGGSTLGEPYRCGAVITEGELNVLSMTTRQGFHRRMLELEPDRDIETLWRLGAVCSENYGHLGPAFVRECDFDPRRVLELQNEVAAWLGHDVASIAATLLATAEAAAVVLGADPDAWKVQVLKAVSADRGARTETGETQADRVLDDLWEILADLAPQIASSQTSTMINEGSKPWLGYREGETIVLRGSVLREALIKKGHDAVRDAIHVLGLGEQTQHRIAGLRVRCYVIAVGDGTPEN